MSKFKEDRIVLEWCYSPKDYFEEPFRRNRDHYELEIDNGRATATVSPQEYERNRSISEEIQNELRDLFAGVQIVTHSPYELSEYTMYREHPDGKKDVTVFPKPGKLVFTSGTLDFRVTNAAGNVVTDTRAERVREKQMFAELMAEYRRRDATAEFIVGSYDAAVRDPGDELVHLFEIQETLGRRFGGERDACSALQISYSKWKYLRKLANSEPLRQGRHRGKHSGQLRDATRDELAEARRVAKTMIRSYFNYLKEN